MPIVIKTLMDYSDRELKLKLHDQADKSDTFTYNDVRLEIERRAQQKHNNRTFYWSMAAVLISGISLLVSILVATLK